MSLPHSGSVPASLYLMNNNNSNQITHDSLGATNNLSDIDLHQQTSQSHPNLVHLAANGTTNNANSTIVHGTNDPGTNASKVSITSINNSNPNDSASTSNPKTLDLEPNPFERSFAQGENNQLSNVHNFTQQQLSNQAQGNNIPMIMMNDVSSLMNQQNAPNSNVLDNTTAPATAGTGISNSTNTTGRNSNVSNTSNSKQVPLDALQPNQIKDLHQQNPTFNFSKQRLDNQPMMSPPVLTPGGSRRLPTSSILPPLHGIVSPGGGSVIGTPGIWNTLFAQTPGAQQSQQQQQQGATSNLSAQMLANLSPNTLSLTQQQLQQQQQQQNKTFINIQNQIQQLQQQQQQVQQQAEQQQAQLQAQLQAAVQNSRSQTYSQTSSQVDSAKNTPLSMKTPQLDNNQQPQQPRNISPHPAQPSSQQMMNGNISASQQAQILNFLSNAKKSGLTPNESSMRTGLTPGPNVFNNNSLYSYLTMTPGILTPSLNGLVSNNNSNSNSNSNNSNNSKPPLTTGMTKNFLSALNGMDLTNFAGNDQVAATINQLQSNNVQQPPKQDPQSSHEQPMQYPGGAGDRPLISNTQFSNGVPLHTSQLSDNSSTKNDTTNNTTPINVSSSTNLKAEAIGRKISHEEVDPSIETKRQKKTASKSKNAYPEDSMTHGLNPGDSSKADNKSANAEGTTTKTSTTKPKRRRQGLSEEEKRQNFLERNRVAASRCRQRKKEMVETMKQELDEYKSENELLKEQVGTLREHALTLRTILFAHRDCDVLTEQVGGLGNLNTVLNTTNYVSQIPDAHKAPESIKVEEVPQLLTGASTNVQAAVAAAVAHTTNKAIERQHRLSNSN